jgi:hypothetical protein
MMVLRGHSAFLGKQNAKNSCVLQLSSILYKKRPTKSKRFLAGLVCPAPGGLEQGQKEIQAAKSVVVPLMTLVSAVMAIIWPGHGIAVAVGVWIDGAWPRHDVRPIVRRSDNNAVLVAVIIIIPVTAVGIDIVAILMPLIFIAAGVGRADNH